MSDSIDAVRMTGIPKLPQDVPPAGPGVSDEPAAPVADPSPETAQAAANRAAREQFVETLGKMEGLSPRFLDYVRERLGLGGRSEIASMPLEEREVNEILADAQTQAAAAAVQIAAVVSDAVAREIEDAFRKGEKASLADVLNELESVLPSETLPAAAKMAFEIFREEMKFHLREIRSLMMGEALRTGKGGDCGAAFAQYSASVLTLVRKASVEPDFDCLTAFRENCRQLRTMMSLCSTLIALVEIAVKLSADIVRYRTACKLAKAKAEAAISALKIRELLAEIKEAFRELDALIQRFKKEMKKEPALVVALRAAAAKHLDAEIREWHRRVSGFEAREERLREETREEMDEKGFERFEGFERCV